MKEIVSYYFTELGIINRTERMNCRVEPSLIKSRKRKNSTRRWGILTTNMMASQLTSAADDCRSKLG